MNDSVCSHQLAYLREQNGQKRGLADGTSEVNHNSENTPSTNGKVRLLSSIREMTCMKAKKDTRPRALVASAQAMKQSGSLQIF